MDNPTAYATFDTFYEGMFQKERLLDIIKNFSVLQGREAELQDSGQVLSLRIFRCQKNGECKKA